MDLQNTVRITFSTPPLWCWDGMPKTVKVLLFSEINPSKPRLVNIPLYPIYPWISTPISFDQCSKRRIDHIVLDLLRKTRFFLISTNEAYS